MGYTTDFTGHVTVTPPLNEDEIAYLTRFAESRRMHRENGPYFIGSGPYGQSRDADIIDLSKPPPEQPCLWCKWVPSEDGQRIEWDGREKFYDSVEWMRYLIDTLFKPNATLQSELANPIPGRHYAAEFAHFTFDHVISGEIDAQGEDPEDCWRLRVCDNAVERIEVDLAAGDPAVSALIDAGWLGHDDPITARDLHGIVATVRNAEAT